MGHHERITVDPGKRNGQPCVRGLRITVGDVLQYLASGTREDQIVREFPELTIDDIRACLAFAADRARQPAQAQARASGDMPHAIDHVNLVVADLDGMVAFFTELLGMRVSKRVTIDGEWIERVVGLRDVRADVVYLELADGPRIELLRYVRPAGDRPAGLGASNTPGLRHLAFRVNGIDALVTRLRAAGVRFISDVQEVPASQVTYAGGARKHLVYFHDPEGNLLELCEYRPAGAGVA